MKEKDDQFLTLFQQLRLNITQNEEFALSQNSFSFIQEEFQIKDAFHNLSKKYFDMEFLSVDFRNSTLAKIIVNEHIKKNTRGEIPTLFHTFDEHAKIILLNYILFQGNLFFFSLILSWFLKRNAQGNSYSSFIRVFLCKNVRNLSLT